MLQSPRFQTGARREWEEAHRDNGRTRHAVKQQSLGGRVYLKLLKPTRWAKKGGVVDLFVLFFWGLQGRSA